MVSLSRRADHKAPPHSLSAASPVTRRGWPSRVTQWGRPQTARPPEPRAGGVTSPPPSAAGNGTDEEQLSEHTRYDGQSEVSVGSRLVAPGTHEGDPPRSPRRGRVLYAPDTARQAREGRDELLHPLAPLVVPCAPRCQIIARVRRLSVQQVAPDSVGQVLGRERSRVSSSPGK